MVYQLFRNKLNFIEKKIRISIKQISANYMKHCFLVIILQVVLFSQVYSQTITVGGRITSGRIAIQNAAVTFIDNADTTMKYTSLTDGLGYYKIDNITSVTSGVNNLPSTFELGQNYPNPFSASTAIPYNLNQQSDIKVTIYDILGREVQNFSISSQTAGMHNILWDGKNINGQKVASGVYFYKLQSKGESLVKKMILNQNGKASIKIPNLFAQTLNSSLNKTGKAGGSTFTIRVENTNTTTPLLVPQVIENVTIQNDTTIDVSVTYIPLATFDFDSLHQIIRGYGAASPWYLPVATDSELESAFGMDNGQIGFSIYRITIEADSNLWAKWVPGTKKAQDMGANIIASPWYAPGDLTEYRDGETRIKLDKYAEYAGHLNSFVKFMEKNGVSIYGLSVQNEPDIGDWTNWSPNEMFTFMKDYAGVIEGTNVMAPESYHFDPAYADPILNDSTSCANTDIVCGHIYGGGLSKYALAEEKGKEVWMTEYLMGENNSGNNMYWAMELAKNINDVMKSDMNAYVWWTMIRYYGPIGDGYTAANPEDPRERYPAKGEVTKKGFVMSQYSKFIRPGYHRVETTTYPFGGNINVTTYKDPSSTKIIIIAINSDSDEIENAFRFGNDIMTSILTPYTTSESKNCEQGDPVNVLDGTFKFRLEPQSITTFISE